MGLSLMGVVVLAGSFDLANIVEAQRKMWFVIPQFLGFTVPHRGSCGDPAVAL